MKQSDYRQSKLNSIECPKPLGYRTWQASDTIQFGANVTK